MVDTIGLTIDQSMVNTSIDFMAEVGAKINVDIKCSNEYRIIGTYRNLHVFITPSYVHIEGSLPKYRYGSNLVTLSREEPGNIIDEIGAALCLPLRDAFVTRVDIAAKLEMNNSPKSYFPYLSFLRNFNRSIDSGSLYYRQTYREFYFYDKVMEAKRYKDPLLTPGSCQKHILRYEMRCNRQWLEYYFDRKIKAIELYGETSDVCCELVAEWYQKYEDIVKVGMVKPAFEMTKMGLFDWLLRNYSLKNDIIKLIDSCSSKGDRKAARLKREVLAMLKKCDHEDEEMVGELNRKVWDAEEAY